MSDEFFDQEGDEQLAVEPSSGALGIVFWQMAQLGNLLEAFEDQFDLPTQAIPFQDLPALNSASAKVVKTSI